MERVGALEVPGRALSLGVRADQRPVELEKHPLQTGAGVPPGLPRCALAALNPSTRPGSAAIGSISRNAV